MTIIKIEKKTCSSETQIDANENQKKTDFFVAVLKISKSFQKNVESLRVILLKKNLKSKTFKLHFDNTQKFFDKWIKKCVNELDFKSNIYQFDRTKILFVFDYLIENSFQSLTST